MAPLLAEAMYTRGRDSWGVTNSERIIKRLGSVLRTDWLDLIATLDNWNLAKPVIFHTRQASTGAVTIKNQHPFSFKKTDGTGLIIGVHNGMVTNHKELNEKHGRDFDCDSMHIFANIAEEKPTKEIKGYGAMVYFDSGNLRFCKFNMCDLNVAKVGDTLVFCSTKRAIEDAADMLAVRPSFYSLVDNKVYFEEDSTLFMAEGLSYEFSKRDDYPVYHGGLVEGNRGAYHYSDNYFKSAFGSPSANYTSKHTGNSRFSLSCQECHRTLSGDEMVVCEPCLDKIMKEGDSVLGEFAYQ